MTQSISPSRLDGQVALVTGGARHLGFRMALTLAEAGARVVVTSRDAESSRLAAADIAARTGTECLGCALDVRDSQSLRACRDGVFERLGSPTILVNNAGGTVGGSPRHLFDRDPADIMEMLNVNLLGTILCTKEFAPAMAERGYGKIINIASVAALVGRDRKVYHDSGLPAQPVEYAAAKAGVLGFTTDCAALLARDGVRINAISPGGFEREGMPAEFRSLYSERTALGRMGDESGRDLSGALLFLCCAESDYVTGHNLVVDGGFSFWK